MYVSKQHVCVSYLIFARRFRQTAEAVDDEGHDRPGTINDDETVSGNRWQ